MNPNALSSEAESVMSQIIGVSSSFENSGLVLDIPYTRYPRSTNNFAVSRPMPREASVSIALPDDKFSEYKYMIIGITTI
jgi:hypothetical protein